MFWSSWTIKAFQARILGHSMGGKIVLWLAQHHPGRFDRIVVADIAARAYVPHHGPIFDALLATRPSEASSREDIEQALRASLNNDPVLVPFLMKGLHRLKTGGFAWRFNVPVLQAALKTLWVKLTSASTRFLPCCAWK